MRATGTRIDPTAPRLARIVREYGSRAMQAQEKPL
jgi:hypothetical protein